MTDNNDQKKKAAEPHVRTLLKWAREKKPQPYKWSLFEQPRIFGAATWEWNLVDGVCHYSSEWATMIGAEDADAESPQNWSWWSGRMHMEDMPDVLKIHRLFFKGHLEEAEILYRLQRPDGRWIRIVSRGAVSQWNDDGTPAVMSGLCMDISHLPMEPPLPEEKEASHWGSEDTSAQEGAFALKKPDCDTTEQRSRLNERRLSALYRLTQMEDASEDEILHFTLTSILQLTNSPGGFLFVPASSSGKGRFFWVKDRSPRIGKAELSTDTPPEEILTAAAAEDPLAARSRLVNGDGKEPVHVLSKENLPIMRYIIAPSAEDGRIVCWAGVCNKPVDYDASDLQQVETLARNMWLLLRRQRHMLELQRAKNAAEAANKAKGEFLANVSHELRTPLNGILSMLQLLEGYSMTEQQREFLNAAIISGNALVHIISDILDFSRIESGKMLLMKEPFDFKASVLSSLRIFREEAEQEGLSFSTEMDPAIPELLLGDDTRIRQIIFNLVGNALKFTKEGRVSVRCILEAQKQQGKAAIRIIVTDTGIGIPKEKQNLLFHAFTQVESFSTKKAPGTGLGLSIVKRLATMMDGDVWLESEVGKGSSVFCTVVLDLPEAPLEDKRSIAPSDKAQEEKALHILAAEDDVVGRLGLRSFLTRLGHSVVCVQNGRQALEALQLYPFDCLLTDIQMPDMDGLELVYRIQTNRTRNFPPSEEIRKLVQEVFPEAGQTDGTVNPHIPIVAVSAHTMAGDRERFLQQGIDYYIPKPIAMRQLKEVLHKVARQVEELNASPSE